MKQLLSILLLSICLYAEATFDQVQSMIDKQQYKQAVLALSVIADNHPNSSKVQFTLAQAQAGLGNLPLAKEALDRAIAINPKLDFVPASQVNELSSIINAPRVIKPVESESHWFIWLLSITGVSFVIAYFIKQNNKSSKLSTPDVKPSTKYSSFTNSSSTANPSKKSYTTEPVSPTNSRSYSEPPKEAPSKPVYDRTSSYEPTRTSRPAEVHYHNHGNSNSGSDVLSTVAVAGLTSAAVSYAMNHHESVPEYRSTALDQPTHSYQPEPVVSESWNDSYSTSSTWDDSPAESTSSSWKDDSSSSSDSWSDNSSSSDSSSSWND